MISLRFFWDTLEPLPDERLLERLRAHRNQLLVASDWAMMPDAPTDKTVWAIYRQALRDLPAGWTPSEEVDLPESPA